MREDVVCLFYVKVYHNCEGKDKVCTQAKWPTQQELILVSFALSDKQHHFSPQDGMLAQGKVTPQNLIRPP